MVLGSGLGACRTLGIRDVLAVLVAAGGAPGAAPRSASALVASTKATIARSGSLWAWPAEESLPAGGATDQLLPALANERVLLDTVGNNPGDPLGWQQSKYADPELLKSMRYTGQVATGETSGTQGVDFSSLGYDFFPKGSTQRLWLDAYSAGVKRTLQRAKAAGIKAYWFVDLLVLPTFVIDAFPNATDGDGKLVWNEASRHLLSVLVDEAFAKFPECDGWVVRTGETYVYDTPYHKGNNPVDGTVEGWASFVTELTKMVCDKHGKQLFIRSWRSWPSQKEWYLDMTDRIPANPKLYFSIKHSSDDFKRPATWNEMLGIGKHAQIVEVQLQREYEGKGAFPNYVMHGIIDGFPEMANKTGLSSIVRSPSIRGLWTWSRGGGWWGPYIHGREQWIDLHAMVLTRWWLAGGQKTEPQVFQEVTPDFLPGCEQQDCLEAFRDFAVSSAEIVMQGQWGRVSTCSSWMRDDRLGGVQQAARCFKMLGEGPPDKPRPLPEKWRATMQEKRFARDESFRLLDLYRKRIMPVVKDEQLAHTVDVSTEYGTHLWSIVASGWKLMGQLYRQDHKMLDIVNGSCLDPSVQEYDAAWAAFRAFGLAEVYSASLYHPYGLCLGTTCSSAFDPPDWDLQDSKIEGKNAYGMGDSVNKLREKAATERLTSSAHSVGCPE